MKIGILLSNIRIVFPVWAKLEIHLRTITKKSYISSNLKEKQVLGSWKILVL
jgi:hypothetical protein